MAELTLRQLNAPARVPAANSAKMFDDVAVLGQAQDSLRYAGSSLKIDYDLATGKGHAAGVHRVTIADALSQIIYPQSEPTPSQEVSIHPAYEDPDELLALARRARTSLFAAGQGNILT